MTDCLYGCPIGSLALELHEPDPIRAPAHGREFRRLTGAIRACLEAWPSNRFPADSDFQLARRIHPDGDGGRGVTGAHLSRRRFLRPGDRPGSACSTTA